ncbi:conserved exported hypothetical protein [Verrucomicrobia bacterium]|nr:conserved exported hypothetical protein [Verrucomicrobiota bacterium]
MNSQTIRIIKPATTRALQTPKTMKAKCKALLTFLGVSVGALGALAQGTAFTYQGRLNDGADPANGFYYMTFQMFSDANGVSPVGSPLLTMLVISNGLFTMPLDFGPGIFTGADRWLQISVTTNASGPYTPLVPLQKLTPSPYAIYASGVTASGIIGTISSASLLGTYSSPLNLTNPINNFSGIFSGNGADITNVNAATLNGLNATNFWQVAGNNVAAGQFIGSSNNQPVELRANGQRALRLEPDTSGRSAPNVIGGSPVNFVTAGVAGATIGGGGTSNNLGSFWVASPNWVTANFGTVGGGRVNHAGGVDATVGGGDSNTAGNEADTVGGGYNNTANGGHAMVGGGAANNAGANGATVSGGLGNTANGAYATVGGGANNSASGANATLGGGSGNLATDLNATVAGGSANTAGGGYNATVGGGSGNIATRNGATVGGGEQNVANGFDATVGGGTANTAVDGATVGGGEQNTAISDYSTVGGGYFNIATNNTWQYEYGAATVGGGQSNTASGGDATVGGGACNTASGGKATVGGGLSNIADGWYSTIGGGNSNVVTGGLYATVPGGSLNFASGWNSFAAGNRAKARHDGAFVWAGGNTIDYGSGMANRFHTYALNGLVVDYDVQRPDGGGSRWILVGAETQFPGQCIATYTGAYLSSVGIWQNACDRNRKTDFAPVSSRAILESLSALPLRSWRYTNEDSAVKHLGPTAQDFQSAFGLGTDDKSIGTVDEEGVALVAIQGLNQKVDDELRAKDAEIAELRQRLEKLERLIDERNGGARRNLQTSTSKLPRT